MKTNIINRVGKTRALTFAFALFFPDVCDAQAQFGVNELHFNTIFAQRNGDPSVYCVLGTGFLRVVRSEAVDSIITGWLAAHPNARVVPVTTSPSGGKRGALVFAWIDDGEQSVNISLIREGAFPGGVMFDAIDYFNQIKFHPNADEMPRRIVSNDRYDAFIKRVIPAENDAKAERRGIWSDKYKEIREQEGIE